MSNSSRITSDNFKRIVQFDKRPVEFCDVDPLYKSFNSEVKVFNTEHTGLSADGTREIVLSTTVGYRYLYLFYTAGKALDCQCGELLAG